MCGILGVINSSVKRDLLAGLNAIKERGVDGVGVYADGKVYTAKTIQRLATCRAKTALGHVLHSVVGHRKQPLLGKGVLSANCEIYNWYKTKLEEKSRARSDSTLLLELLDKYGPKSTINKIRGVYAFAYLRGNELILARDLIGIKPLFYSREDGLAFCSEPKGLKAMGYKKIEELNPRSILAYNLKTKKVSFRGRSFFRTTPVIRSSERDILKQLDMLFSEALKLRIPKRKCGLLLSGGVDSALLAAKLKQLGGKFTCYTAAVSCRRWKAPEDIEYSKKVAKELGLKHKTIIIKKSQVPEYIKKVVPLIEDANVVKTGVAIPFFLACEQAKKDKVKVIFSGLGADEVFGGYAKQAKATDLNKECSSAVLKAYEKDTFRDDVVTMHNNIELRVPYYDVKLVQYGLRIPKQFKLTTESNKYILRELAKFNKLPVMFADRKKKATQYGSNMDKAIEYHAKRAGFKTKSSFLQTFLNRPNLKLAALFSGGKDSALALHIMHKRSYEVSCLISMKSKNQESYMFHTPNIDLVDLQAKAMNIPLIMQVTEGKKEAELEDMKIAIAKAKNEYGIEGVIVGAIHSTYQRDRVEKVCDSLGVKIFAPLWHMDQIDEMKMLLKENFKFIIVSIAAMGLDKSLLGKVITKTDLDYLIRLMDKYKINVAGEGGEYETLVLDGPMFKQKLEIKSQRIIEESDEVARIIVEQATLSQP